MILALTRRDATMTIDDDAAMTFSFRCKIITVYE